MSDTKENNADAMVLEGRDNVLSGYALAVSFASFEEKPARFSSSVYHFYDIDASPVTPIIENSIYMICTVANSSYSIRELFGTHEEFNHELKQPLRNQKSSSQSSIPKSLQLLMMIDARYWNFGACKYPFASKQTYGLIETLKNGILPIFRGICVVSARVARFFQKTVCHGLFCYCDLSERV